MAQQILVNMSTRLIFHYPKNRCHPQTHINVLSNDVLNHNLAGAVKLVKLYNLCVHCTFKTFRAEGVNVASPFQVEAYFRSTLQRMNDFLAGHDLCPVVLCYQPNRRLITTR